MTVPSRDEALSLLRQAGCSQGVVEHCQLVTRIALRLARSLQKKGFRVDTRLVESGGILHDIGRSVTHGIDHGVVGGDVARRLGIDPSVVRIIERHVGAGLTPEEARKTGLPDGQYVPETLEEKIVCYADKLTDGTREAGIDVEVEKLSLELGSGHSAVRRLRDLHSEITGLLK